MDNIYITDKDGVRELIKAILSDLSSQPHARYIVRVTDRIHFTILPTEERLGPSATSTHDATGSAIEDSPSET